MATAVLARPRQRLSTRQFVALVSGAAVLLRLPGIAAPLHTDEAGYMVVAHAWRAGGPNLYGHYFVDRPPLLLAMFRLADITGWPQSIRVLATGFVVMFVVAAAWAAHEVTGDRGVRWAALVAGALGTTPVLLANEADGEIFAAPLVMLAVAMTLAAVRRTGRASFLLATGAGLAAGAAVMTKQNFVDAVVFAVVLLVAGVWQHRTSWRDAARVAGGGVVGGSLVVAAALVLVAWSRVGLSVAWTAVFGVRRSALDVIEDHSLHAPMTRAIHLGGLSVVAGLVPFMVVLGILAWHRRLKGSPVAWAIAITIAVEWASIASGGSYWPHYLLQVAPMLALAAGVWAPGAAGVRAVVVFVVASAVAATALMVVSDTAVRHHGEWVGAWLRESGHGGDTATVLFGNAEVQQASGMTSPYQQLWTLPMRTIDPHLSTLRTVLRGPHAPTWVVVWSPGLDPWGIDANHRTRHLLATRYHEAASVCGHDVYLRNGEHRPLAPPTCPRTPTVDIGLPSVFGLRL